MPFLSLMRARNLICASREQFADSEAAILGLLMMQECCKSMERLFKALAEAEAGLPFLAKQEVQRGTRCLAQCDIGDENSAWNR